MRRAGLLPGLLLSTACVYFNTMYNAERAYDRGLTALREGNTSAARVAFDSVIAKTDRVVRDHPGSKYADDAALLKTRAELHNRKWEAAAGSADLAAQLGRDSVSRALAQGFLGVALYHQGKLEPADSLLTFALAGEIPPDDRAMFLFNRGLVRLDLGQPGPASDDLRAASQQIDLSPEARLDLAAALIQIGEYGEAGELTADLLQADRFGNLNPALRVHLDSLSRRDPDGVDSILARLLRVPSIQPTKASTLYFLRGRARQFAEDPERSLVYLDSAVSVAATARYAGDAAYYAARQRLSRATRPQDVSRTLDNLVRSQSSVDAGIREDGVRLHAAARRFDALMAAYDSRGASAAEAVLRAAEIAGAELGSPAVARGLYLLYVQLAPESRWAAKAISGAMTYSGHVPGDWIEDRGDATDAELSARLSGLPANDPYRVALEGRGREVPLADSMYALAESDLRERIERIQMLFEPSPAEAAAGEEVPGDTAAAPADTTAAQQPPARE